MTGKNSKSRFQKTEFWLLYDQAIITKINPNQGFEEGLEGFEFATTTKSSDLESSVVGEDVNHVE